MARLTTGLETIDYRLSDAVLDSPENGDGRVNFVKLEDHDIRTPILGMGCEVAFSRRILFKATTNRHDLPRTVLLDPLLDQVNCVREPADEGCVDHCGCPYLATARPVAVERRPMSPPQGRSGFPSAHR
jgi:hypothetical protein